MMLLALQTATPLTPAGWLFMLGSIAFVLGLLIFCLWRVLSTPDQLERMHAPIEIDTQDRDT